MTNDEFRNKTEVRSPNLIFVIRFPAQRTAMVRPPNHWFHDTVSALAYSLAQPHAGAPERQDPFNDLTQFILRQHANLPDYLRTPMLAATMGFDGLGVLRGGKCFHRQRREQRQR